MQQLEIEIENAARAEIETYRVPGAPVTLLQALREFADGTLKKNVRLYFSGEKGSGTVVVSMFPGKNDPRSQFHVVRGSNAIVVHQIMVVPFGGNKMHMAALALFQESEHLDAVVVEANLSDEFLESLECRGWYVAPSNMNAILFRGVARLRVNSAIRKFHRKLKPKKLTDFPPPPILVRRDEPHDYGMEWVSFTEKKELEFLPEDELERMGFGKPCRYV